MSTARTSSSGDRPLDDRLRAYGCPDLVRLDEPLTRPEQIDYLDLLPHRSSRAVVHAVAEHQGTALLYLLDAAREPADDIPRLLRLLANRSDPAWLGVVRPGSLELHPIGFHRPEESVPLVSVEERDPRAPLCFQRLVHGELEGHDQLQGSDHVFHKIYKLLVQTVDEYVSPDEESVVRPLEILSMAGRALFFRFLVDRRIVRASELPDVCPEAQRLRDAFADAENAARTSAWLDETFNGDFLRLVDESIPQSDRAARYEAYARYYRDVERRAGSRFFDHLHAILNGWHAVGGGFQTELDWQDFDFAHIPVGVLSQVYESFSHRADPKAARRTSTHYTPRNVASLMVSQVFAAADDPAAATVLDPACGAGIFLVLAFRRLVRERWQAGGERPNTRQIQQILYQQIRGFDVSEPALRLAALALYITAIEVNGSTRPPKSLKFPEDLRDSVLFHFGDDENGGDDGARSSSTFPLGSLGPRVPAAFDGSFDIVLGNPPWTRLREAEAQSTAEGLAAGRSKRTETAAMNRRFTAIAQRVLRARGLDELAAGYRNPDKNPDLPFLWRAAEWSKPRGLISFALPARVFGRTTGPGLEAWRAVLRAFAITGLVNGADLRKTAVWESVDMPFCVLFARNAKPAENHRFYYSSPSYEPRENRHARFRIDYEATRPISVERVERQPWVLKALSLGTWRDVAVMERILAAFPRSLAQVWRQWDPGADKTGKGYDRSPGLKQKPASFLGRLLHFKPTRDAFSIDYSALMTYADEFHRGGSADGREATAYRPKTEALYQPPLVIVPQSPGDDPEAPRAFLSRRPLAFSQSYYGYSCAGHAEPETLAALIYLLAHSKLFTYFSLMTSRRTGFDRQTFNKGELDAIAFPDVAEELSAAERIELRRLAERLEHDDEKPWDDIDSAIFDLYELDADDAQVVRDTLFSAASYRLRGRPALERTSRRHREPFRTELCAMLQPYFEVCGARAAVEEPADQPDTWRQPWFFLAVTRDEVTPRLDTEILQRAMEEANRQSASRILVRMPERQGLLLGLLNQRRWWTVTRARLCGQHILRHHLEAFELT